MKPATKRSLVGLGLFVITVPLLYVLAVTFALRAHWEEDSIVLGGKQIQYAIDEYVEKNGSPPVKLEKLIPEFLHSMPVLPPTADVHYSVGTNGQWTLDIHRPRREMSLIYRRTNVGLSAEDAKRQLHTENGCYVLTAR